MEGLKNKLLLCILVGFSAVSCTEKPKEQEVTRSEQAELKSAEKSTFVIVHGAWGGSWAFREVEMMMREKGYDVYRPSLTGQGERVHLAKYLKPDLTMHIEDVVNAILFEELHDIILIGHSYGGMVVTGVADSIPERIKNLVYLDAMIPFDGESVATINGRSNEEILEENPSGFWIPDWLDLEAEYPADVPHPLGTLVEPIRLSGKGRTVASHYILTVDEGASPESDGFYKHYQRAKDFDWPVSTFISDHNPQWSHPEALVDKFLEYK